MGKKIDLKKDFLSGFVDHLYRKDSTKCRRKLFSPMGDHKLSFSCNSSGIYNVMEVVGVFTKRLRKINTLGMTLK